MHLVLWQKKKRLLQTLGSRCGKYCLMREKLRPETAKWYLRVKSLSTETDDWYNCNKTQRTIISRFTMWETGRLKLSSFPPRKRRPIFAVERSKIGFSIIIVQQRHQRQILLQGSCHGNENEFSRFHSWTILYSTTSITQYLCEACFLATVSIYSVLFVLFTKDALVHVAWQQNITFT